MIILRYRSSIMKIVIVTSSILPSSTTNKSCTGVDKSSSEILQIALDLVTIRKAHQFGAATRTELEPIRLRPLRFQDERIGPVGVGRAGGGRLRLEEGKPRHRLVKLRPATVTIKAVSPQFSDSNCMHA